MTDPRGDRTEADYVFPRGRGNLRANVKTPPGGTTGSKQRKTRSRGKMSNAQLRDELEKTLSDVGFFVSFADAFDGQVVKEAAPNIAAQWGELASKNDAVRKALEGFVASSAWGAAISSIAIPTVLILAHHNAIPTPPFMRGQSAGQSSPANGNGAAPSSPAESTDATVTNLRPETPTPLDDSALTGHVKL